MADSGARVRGLGSMQGRPNDPLPWKSTAQGLPRQLSASMLGILLIDLVEYNGVATRTVPLRTFRGKYIGLYFGVIENSRCEQFLEQLRAFYQLMNHRFECVLVSFDGTEEQYTKHMQLTAWPTYPRGDYRPALLRSHFDIRTCPELVIIDPNGIVITSNGVEMVEKDQASFPWYEKVIGALWNEDVQGQLAGVFEQVHFPPKDGVEAIDHKVVGFIFGELWCPEAREIVTRLAYLMERVNSRMDANASNRLTDDRADCDTKDVTHPIVIYFVHSQPITKYSTFLCFDMPFQSVRLQGERREQLRYFVGVVEEPTFTLVSPKGGWVVKDAADWLLRDPAGVCFPWVPRQVGVTDARDVGFLDVAQPLREETLCAAISQGPVFVAFFHNVHAHRSEAIATFRAVAATYISRAAERSKSMWQVGLDLEDTLGEIGDGSSTFERLRHNLCRPACSLGHPPPPEPEAADGDSHGQLLLGALQRLADQQSSGMGEAPWNNPAREEWPTHRAALTFFFSTHEDRTTAVLHKFCCMDAQSLQRHQLWKAGQARLLAKESEARAEMMSKLERAATSSPDYSTVPRVSTVPPPLTPTGCVSPSPARPESAQPELVRTESSSSEERGQTPDSLSSQNRDDEERQLDDGEKVVRPHLPKVTYDDINETTEKILGVSNIADGTGIIIDRARGSYYICGSLTNKHTLLSFLDAWDLGNLDPFEIRLANAEEVVNDAEHDMAREMALYSQLASGSMAESVNSIPGIIIWLPTLQHSEDGSLGPERLFRALLHYAYQKCPREDNLDTCTFVNSRIDIDDKEFHGSSLAHRKLTPWIEKFWIFGLLGEEETDDGGFQPPASGFLEDLHSYICDIITASASACETPASRKTQGSSGFIGDVGSRSCRARGLRPRPEDLLIPQTDLFEDGLRELRCSPAHECHTDQLQILNNYNILMRTAQSRHAVHAAMIEEISYYMLVEYAPPPLFILLVGDFPAVSDINWPAGMHNVHLHILGKVPSVSSYRDVSPALTMSCWDDWTAAHLEDRISNVAARLIGVPWM